MTDLRTDRLLLRAAQEDDLAPLFRIYSSADAMRYWSNPPHETMEETRATLDKLRGADRADYFVIEHDGTVIGIGGIHVGTEIGFLFHPDCWGQGFGLEAVGAIIAHVWDNTDLQRITADVDPRNLASVKLLTRLGFLMTGYARNTYCVGGEWSDSAYFALPRPV